MRFWKKPISWASAIAALAAIMFVSCPQEADYTDNSKVYILTVNQSGEFYLNGEEKGTLDLPAGATNLNLNRNAAVVSGGKSYILGGYRDAAGTYKFCYWADGVRTELDTPAGYYDSSYERFIVSGGNVYVYDYVYPYYWVNGVRTNLDIPEGTRVQVLSFTVSNGNVYAAGSCYNIDDGYDDYNRKAYYWVNGVRADLGIPSGSETSQFGTIVVSGGKVYVSGSYGYYETAGSDYYLGKACYWVDGERTDLSVPDGTENSSASSITILNGKVYAAGGYGYYEITDYGYAQYRGRKPCYWVNGARTDLSVHDGIEAFAFIAIANNNATRSNGNIPVSNGKLYMQGLGYDYDSSNERYYYWGTDGKRTDLVLPPTTDSWISMSVQLTAAGGKVYAWGSTFGYRGIEDHKACYWVDGIRTDLDIPDGDINVSPDTFDLVVSDSKVHIIASYRYYSDTEFGNRFLYWIDGVKQEFPGDNIAVAALVAE